MVEGVLSVTLIINKNRILLSFTVGPKIQASGHLLTKQIRIITYLFQSLNIFSVN